MDSKKDDDLEIKIGDFVDVTYFPNGNPTRYPTYREGEVVSRRPGVITVKLSDGRVMDYATSGYRMSFFKKK